MSDKRKALMTTYSGRMIDPFNPDPKQIILEDIVQSLSLQVRFCGHVRSLITVAQHSVMVSEMCQTEKGKKWGLFHDASEAYISDVPRPVKAHLPIFKDMEKRLLKASAENFKMAYPVPQEVSYFDYISLYRESRDFMPNGACVPCPEEYDVPQSAWTPEKARERYREQYYKLFKKPL